MIVSWSYPLEAGLKIVMEDKSTHNALWDINETLEIPKPIWTLIIIIKCKQEINCNDV